MVHVVSLIIYWFDLFLRIKKIDKWHRYSRKKIQSDCCSAFLGNEINIVLFVFVLVYVSVLCYGLSM